MNPETQANTPDESPEFDALTAGIEPGGLRSTTDIKLLICYMLNAVGEPVSREHIAEILQHDGLANYFEIVQSVTELLSQGNLSLLAPGGQEMYSITETGRDIAETLEVFLPHSVRKKAVAAAVKLLARVRSERENRVEIEKAENGYLVTCRVLDGGIELMSTRILVADNLQAETVRQYFLDNPALIYSGILALLTGDINPVLEAEAKRKSDLSVK